jgi:GTP-binding protein
VPNLGVVAYKDGLSFVVADIPGLIEGASDGVGLGLQFLRHVERCRVLVHLIDLSASVEGRDPVHDFEVLNRELEQYSQSLAQTPQIVVANKLDLPHAQEAMPKFLSWANKRGITVLAISAATTEGVPKLLDTIAKVLWAKPGHLPKEAYLLARPKPKSQKGKAARLPAAKKRAPAAQPVTSKRRATTRSAAQKKRAATRKGVVRRGKR